MCTMHGVISCVFAYRMKLNILRRKGVTKILPRGYIVILSNLCNAIKKSSTKFRCIATLNVKTIYMKRF